MRDDREIRTYVTAMAASGGILMRSDKLPLLTEAQLARIEKLFPLNTAAARPLDYETAYIPGVLDFGLRGRNRTVALINWGETEKTFTLPGSAGRHVFEFWESRYCGVPAGDYSVAVEPHGCRVYTVTEAGGPAVVGTDASLVMDVRWEYDGAFHAAKNKPDETLFAVGPDGALLTL